MPTDHEIQFPRREAKVPNGSLARYLKSFTLSWSDDEQAGFESDLRRFAAGDDGGNAHPLLSAASSVAMLYARHRSRHLRDALAQAGTWRESAERSAAHGVLLHRLEAEIDFAARRAQPASHPPLWPDFEGAVQHAAHLLALGWDDLAAAQARRLVRLLRARCVMLDAEKFVTQHFVLRLLADWQGVSSHWTWPKASRKEPLFERVLAIWRDPGATDELAHLLAVACDRHWLQSSTSGSKHFDLGHSWEFFDGYEVLVVRALRQRLGLAVPEVDHPLAQTLLARPQAPSAPWQDELIAGVTQRARVLLPAWDREGSDLDPA